MIDSTDEKILRELMKDCQQSHRKIAREIGVSLGTVISRMKKMEENGVIKGYIAHLNFEKLGYELTVLTEVTVSGGKVLEVGEGLAKMSGVSAAYNITGGSDIMVIARFKNKKDVSNFTKQILGMPNVERTETHLVLVTFKEDLGLP